MKWILLLAKMMHQHGKWIFAEYESLTDFESLQFLFSMCKAHTRNRSMLWDISQASLCLIFIPTRLHSCSHITIFFSVPLVSVHSGTHKQRWDDPNKSQLEYKNKCWIWIIVYFHCTFNCVCVCVCNIYCFTDNSSLMVYKIFFHLLQCRNLPTNPTKQNRWSPCSLLAEELTEISRHSRGCPN